MELLGVGFGHHRLAVRERPGEDALRVAPVDERAEGETAAPHEEGDTEWIEIPDRAPGPGEGLIRHTAIGVNYVDTAYPYHDGASERWLGQALRVVARDLFGPGDAGFAELRGRLKVATKLPMFNQLRLGTAIS